MRKAARCGWNNNIVDEEEPTSANGPAEGAICGEKRWCENAGTMSRPKLRQVCYGLFVYSERQEKWVPHSKGASSSDKQS